MTTETRFSKPGSFLFHNNRRGQGATTTLRHLLSKLQVPVSLYFNLREINECGLENISLLIDILEKQRQSKQRMFVAIDDVQKEGFSLLKDYILNARHSNLTLACVYSGDVTPEMKCVCNIFLDSPSMGRWRASWYENGEEKRGEFRFAHDQRESRFTHDQRESPIHL